MAVIFLPRELPVTFPEGARTLAPPYRFGQNGHEEPPAGVYSGASGYTAAPPVAQHTWPSGRPTYRGPLRLPLPPASTYGLHREATKEPQPSSPDQSFVPQLERTKRFLHSAYGWQDQPSRLSSVYDTSGKPISSLRLAGQIVTGVAFGLLRGGAYQGDNIEAIARGILGPSRFHMAGRSLHMLVERIIPPAYPDIRLAQEVCTRQVSVSPGLGAFAWRLTTYQPGVYGPATRSPIGQPPAPEPVPDSSCGRATRPSAPEPTTGYSENRSSEVPSGEAPQEAGPTSPPATDGFAGTIERLELISKPSPAPASSVLHA